MRSGVGLGNAEVGEQARDRLGGHRRAAVGMEGQLPGRNRLLGAGLGDQAFSQVGLLAVGDHPADHGAAVDVEDDVQVVVGPRGWAEQLGDVPATWTYYYLYVILDVNSRSVVG